MPSKAFEACEALYAQYPQSARPLDDRDQTMPVSLGGQPYDLVRHLFQGRRVIYRLYPAGASRGTEIGCGDRVPAGLTGLLAAARPLR